MCSGSEAGSYLRLIDSCITQLKAQGPSRTCTASKRRASRGIFPEMCSGSEAGSYLRPIDFVYHSTLGLSVIKKKIPRNTSPWFVPEDAGAPVQVDHAGSKSSTFGAVGFFSRLQYLLPNANAANSGAAPVAVSSPT